MVKNTVNRTRWRGSKQVPGGRKTESRASREVAAEACALASLRQRRYEWVCRGLLLALGIYLAWVYFGQKAVPNSDFTAFVDTGNAVLHFQMPSSFKRVPVLGMLQIAAGKLMVTSPHPVFTGALVLNGVLYTLSILLFYRICRFFFEKTGSYCVALLAAINPWSLVMVVDPIAETAIVFFLLLTLYLILSRSRWCYLAAMLASMVRYELFLLIGIALLFDLFECKPKRAKLIAIGVAGAAAVPMIVWMIGTKLTTTTLDSHYFRIFFGVEHRNGFDFLKALWQTSFSALLQWPEWIRAALLERPSGTETQSIESHYRTFQVVWNSIAAVSFVMGVVWMFVKKEWKLASVLLFWIAYAPIHMLQSVLIDRYTVPIAWLTLLVAAFGLVRCAKWAAGRMPKGVTYALAGFAGFIGVCWVFDLYPAVEKTAVVSPASSTVVYAGCLVLFAVLACKQFLVGRGAFYNDACLFFVAAAMIVSNQFSLAFRLGQGDLDIEFRKTAEWYLENAEDGKLASTLPGVVNLFLPEGRKNAVHTGGVSGTNLIEFAESCRRSGVKYVAWDSRLGFAPNDYYYKGWGLKKIHLLGIGKDVGPFKFVRKIEANQNRYINLYCLE